MKKRGSLKSVRRNGSSGRTNAARRDNRTPSNGAFSAGGTGQRPRPLLDDLDWALLDALQRDASQSQASLGATLGVATSTINERIRRLQAQGVLIGPTYGVSPEDVGLPLCAFVQVSIDRPSKEAQFLQQVAATTEIQECHCVTGPHAFLLKVRARSPQDLEAILRSRIKNIPGVVRTETVIALATHKDSHLVALARNTRAG